MENKRTNSTRRNRLTSQDFCFSELRPKAIARPQSAILSRIAMSTRPKLSSPFRPRFCRAAGTSPEDAQ